jgi:hypothetical protein
MSPLDHLIVTVIGRRRAQTQEPGPEPAPVGGRPGRQPTQPPPGRRPAESGET